MGCCRFCAAPLPLCAWDGLTCQGRNGKGGAGLSALNGQSGAQLSLFFATSQFLSYSSGIQLTVVLIQWQVFLLPGCSADSQPAYTCSIAWQIPKVSIRQNTSVLPFPSNLAVQPTFLSASPPCRLHPPTGKLSDRPDKLQHPTALLRLLLPRMCLVPHCRKIHAR